MSSTACAVTSAHNDVSFARHDQGKACQEPVTEALNLLPHLALDPSLPAQFPYPAEGPCTWQLARRPDFACVCQICLARSPHMSSTRIEITCRSCPPAPARAGPPSDPDPIVSPSWRASASRHQEPAGAGHCLSHINHDNCSIYVDMAAPGAMTGFLHAH